jgi:hypothetical protein
MTDAQKAQYQSYFKEILQKLYPEHDWVKDPIEFVLSDVDYGNAFYYNGKNKHVIGFTKPYLNVFETEDRLAYVLAHEYYHLFLRKELGKHKNSKGEEALADTVPLERLEAAGYDSSIALAHREAELGNEQPYTEIEQFVVLVDPHPTDSARRTLVKSRLFQLSQKLGGLNHTKGITRRPLNEPFRNLLGTLHFVAKPEKRKQKEETKWILEINVLSKNIQKTISSIANDQNKNPEEKKQLAKKLLKLFENLNEINGDLLSEKEAEQIDVMAEHLLKHRMAIEKFLLEALPEKYQKTRQI